MKKLNFYSGLFLSILFTVPSFSDQTIISSPDTKQIWGGSIVDRHGFSRKKACTAFLESTSQSGRKGTLEMTAMSHLGNQYQQATVMASLAKSYSGTKFDFHRAELTILLSGGKRTTFQLLRADNGQSTDQLATGLAKIDERRTIIDALKAGNTAEVTFYKNNQIVDKTQFSLRGSSSAISGVEKTCGLRLN